MSAIKGKKGKKEVIFYKSTNAKKRYFIEMLR